MKRSLLGFLSIFLLAFGVQAQDKQLSEDEVLLKKIVEDFAEAYATVGQSKDGMSVLKYMHPRVSATLVSSNVNENVKVVESDYKGFTEYLKGVVRTEGVKIDYEITDFLRIYARGTIGVVAYVVEYTNKKDGEVWAKGNEMVTLTFKKIDDSWKIIHYTVLGIEDEKNRGACLCEIFAGNANDYVVKTTVPAGRTYETSLNNFEFRSAPRNSSFVTVGDKKYRWLANGELWRTDAQGNQTTKLGRAVKHDEVILFVIRQDLFADNCAGIKVKG